LIAMWKGCSHQRAGARSCDVVQTFAIGSTIAVLLVAFSGISADGLGITVDTVINIDCTGFESRFVDKRVVLVEMEGSQ
jgi:hypothetical protein